MGMRLNREERIALKLAIALKMLAEAKGITIVEAMRRVQDAAAGRCESWIRGLSEETTRKEG